MSEVKAVVLGGLIAAASGAAAQYLISYKLIEAPRLQLEGKRLALEASNQMQKLIPVVDSECNADPITRWEFRIVCNFTNKSTNPTYISIEEISLISKNKPKETKYLAGAGYNVEYPNDRRRYLSFPGNEGYIDAYLIFDRKAAPNGINTQAINAYVSYDATTHPEAKKLLVHEFSELEQYANKIATQSRGVIFPLPLTAGK